MEFDRDLKAGYKHHLSDRYRIYLKQKVMDMCHSNGLNQVDLLTSAERKISEKEYWAKRRGQKISMNTIQNWKRKDLLQDRQPFKRRSNTFVIRLIQLFYRQHPKKNFPDCCLRNIILHLKSVVADTATCILIVKNTLLEEISEHFMKKIIFCRYSRRTQTDSHQKSHILLTEQLLIFQNCQNCLFLTKLTKPHTLSFL